MNYLFINACYFEEQYFVDIKTFIILNIYNLAESPNLKLNVRISPEIPSHSIAVNLNHLTFNVVTEILDATKSCTWPIILLQTYVISGICSVCRQICKLSTKSDVKSLLGFRDACLVACAESSVWTKYCEIDIIQTITDILNNNCIHNNFLLLPDNIVKYENHLSQPVRIHNIYKIARNNQNDQGLTSSTPRKDLDVHHKYAEGPYTTLADMILYPCFKIFLKYCHDYQFSIESKIPLIETWVKRLADLTLLDFCLQVTKQNFENKVIVPQIKNVSLYNADPSRTLSIKYTKQYKIGSALMLIDNVKDIKNCFLPFGHEETFDWNTIPLDANPHGGALPAKRANRKCAQLENLLKAVIKVVGNKSYKIVDFCSGSGHLGILVAFLLKECQVLLVENKERSLSRAKETISKLQLKNVTIIQSNLDYFVGEFNLGIALHACGVATDLVIQMCIKNKAHFICCPCCYGGIKNCHSVFYPRSNKFQNIFHGLENQFFNLAHAADQTHEEENAKNKQGYFCMDVIDTDRRCFAETHGYKVHLGKLQPINCTNKNNLLVGIYLGEIAKDN